MKSTNSSCLLGNLEQDPRIFFQLEDPSDEECMAAIKGDPSMLEHVKIQKTPMIQLALNTDPEKAMPYIRDVDETTILWYIYKSRYPVVMPNMVECMTLKCWMMLLKKNPDALKFMSESQRKDIIERIQRADFGDQLLCGIVINILTHHFGETPIIRPFNPVIADPRLRPGTRSWLSAPPARGSAISGWWGSVPQSRSAFGDEEGTTTPYGF